MAEVKLGELYKVVIIESERGWKTEVIESKYFETKLEALEFVVDYNKRLTKAYVPDYYVMALYVGGV